MVEFIIEKMIVLAAISSLFALAFLISKYTRTFNNPASIIITFWATFLLIPQLTIFGARIDPFSVLFILLFWLFFGAGFLITTPKYSDINQIEFKPKKVHKFAFISGSSSIFFSFLVLIQNDILNGKGVGVLVVVASRSRSRPGESSSGSNTCTLLGLPHLQSPNRDAVRSTR